MIDASKIQRALAACAILTSLASLNSCSKSSSQPGDSSAKGVEVTLFTSGGESFAAYVAGPENAGAAVLVVHDWFGITDMTHGVVERLGALGYRALAVDLYGGQSADNHKDAWNLMSNLDTALATGVIASALENLKSAEGNIATLGFSMGGKHAFLAALAHPNAVSAVIVCYGETINDTAALANLQAPVLVIGGGQDEPGTIYQFAQTMESIGKSAEVYVYPGAGHAFAQKLFNKGKNYNESATEMMWTLAESFLERHLK